jgi:hypothetical protein
MFNGTQHDLSALVSRELPDVHPEINRCGQMVRIEADRAVGPALLTLLLSQNVRIVKYEESI